MPRHALAHRRFRKFITSCRENPLEFVSLIAQHEAMPVFKCRKDVLDMFQVLSMVPAMAWKQLDSAHDEWKDFNTARDILNGGLNAEAVNDEMVVRFFCASFRHAPFLDTEWNAFMQVVFEGRGAQRNMIGLLIMLVTYFETKNLVRVRTLLQTLQYLPSTGLCYVVAKLKEELLLDMICKHNTAAIRNCAHAILDRTNANEDQLILAFIEQLLDTCGPQLVDVEMHMCAVYEFVPSGQAIAKAIQILARHETPVAKSIIRHLPPMEVVRLWSPDLSMEVELFRYAVRNGCFDAYKAFCEHYMMNDCADLVCTHAKTMLKSERRQLLESVQRNYDCKMRQTTSIQELKILYVMPVGNKVLIDELRNRILDGDEHDVCPISYQKAILPVRDAAGHVYERDYISAWIARNSTNPFTRLPMDIHDIECHLDFRRA